MRVQLLTDLQTKAEVMSDKIVVMAKRAGAQVQDILMAMLSIAVCLMSSVQMALEQYFWKKEPMVLVLASGSITWGSAAFIMPTCTLIMLKCLLII